MVKVKAKIKFKDLGLNKWKELGDKYEVDEKRAEYLESIGFVEVVKEKRKTNKELVIEKAISLGLEVTEEMTEKEIKELIKVAEQK